MIRWRFNWASWALVLLLAICGSASAQTVPVSGTADVTELSQRLDKRFAVIPAPVSCVLNNPAVDNAPIINAALNRLAGEVELPAGAIYTRSSIVLPRRTGITLRGQGCTIALPRNSFDRANPAMTGGPATRIIYLGPADQPAVKYLGSMGRLDGLTIQRGDMPQPPAPQPRDGSVGLQIGGSVGLATGKLYVPQLSIMGFDTAVSVVATSDGESSDQNVFGQFWSEHNWTTFRSTANQSVANHFLDLTVGGFCETVFDVQNGGAPLVDNLTLNNRALILRLAAPQHNIANCTIQNLKVDNNAAGWRLVNAPKAWGLRLRVGGEMGNKATPGPNAVNIVPANQPEHIDAEIDLWNGATYKRWEWQAVGQGETK